MKQFCILALSFTLFMSQRVLAQEISVSGEVLDTVQFQDMAGATVRLLRDTAMVTTAAAGPGGIFHFRHIPAGDYTLSVSFQGYETFTGPLRRTRVRVYMRLKADSLGEVVIRDNRPVIMHGDTTSYEASQFHTRPNGMLDDLLKKLPGVDDMEGPLMAMGDTVKRILVNGKRFFGDNLQLALQNLPRDIIARIEVFDDKSDQAKFSGIDDGIRIRTINIVTKRSVKLGAVGLVGAGGGTDGNETLYNGKGSVTHFKGQSMTVLAANANNTNPVEGGSSRNITGGLNFSDNWSKKNQFSGSVQENNSAMRSTIDSYTQNLLPGDSSIYNTRHQQNSNNSSNQSANLNLELDPDSVDHFTIRGNGGLQASSGNAQSAATSNLDLTTPLNQTSNASGNKNHGGNASLSMVWGRRFHKQGRSLMLSLSGNTEAGTGTGTSQYAYTYFHPGRPDSAVSANQYYTGPNNSTGGSAGLSYNEPLNKHSSLYLSLTASANGSHNGRYTYQLDSLTHRYDQIDTLLTNLYTNTNSATGGGFIYQYGKKNLQVSAGLTLTENRLETLDGSNGIDLKQRYLSVAPQIGLWAFSKSGANIRVTYSGATIPAPLNALHPLANNSDPLHVTVGNPGLKQSFHQNLSASYNIFNRKTLSHFYVNMHLSYTTDPIGTRSLLDPLTGVDTTSFTNLGASYNYHANASYGWRLHQPASNIGFGANFSGAHNEGFLNGILNASDMYSFGASVQWNSNLPDHLDVNFWYGPELNINQYSAEPGRNTHYFTQQARLNWLWYKGNWQIGTDGNFTGNSGRPAGFNTNIMIWSASASRMFFKRQQGELKLEAHDLLNQSSSVNQIFSPTMIQNTQGRMLGRYYLLSFIYHLKG